MTTITQSEALNFIMFIAPSHLEIEKHGLFVINSKVLSINHLHVIGNSFLSSTPVLPLQIREIGNI